MSDLSFQERFIQTKGEPFMFEGNEIMMGDDLDVPPDFLIRVTLVSTDAERSQAVSVLTQEGTMESLGVEATGFVMWEEDLREGPCDIRGIKTDGKVLVFNSWDIGGRTPEEWYDGAAMTREEPCPGRPACRYRCSDGRPDGNFGNIVFEVEVIE